mmetsp:Transcript_34177/g.80085  ORF Transcript_34177/g.80085 Transcript_34177/m.80085 type:complete len:302 (-) Transcript_34177:140-1045(-)
MLDVVLTFPAVLGCDASATKSSFLTHSLGCSLDDIAAAAPPNSASLQAYLQATYAAASESAQQVVSISSTWRWADVGIVWRGALPSHLRSRCVPVKNATGNATLWQRVTNAFASPPGSLWANEAAATTTDLDKDTARSAPATMSGRWVEVTHVHNPSPDPHPRRIRPRERQALWLYQAAGSGLWFWTGTRLVTRNPQSLRVALRDVDQGAHNLSANFIDWVRTRGFGGQQIDTIEFTHTSDRCWPTLRHELLGLRANGSTGQCPPSDDMRAGLWRERKCVCRSPVLRAGEAVRCVAPRARG